MITNNEDWLNEIQNCKQIKKQNRVVKDFKNSFDKRINNNNKEINNTFIIYNNLNYDYILKKNETLGIDKKLDKKLKNGNFIPDIKVDFHGLTLDNAFDCLINTVNYAYENGLKFVLAVTGKGYGTKSGKDSIKSQIDHWMTHPEISAKVIKYTDAQQKDGGTGAIYILIKTKK
ncbi:MAG: Smr/MutS family protein [Rickettsiales bacterium]|nr:Smr/MutS family protein [Rickettsiales bacterium]